MRKTLMTAGWAFAAIVLLAACHGTNQGETVNVAPDQAPQMTGTTSGDATAGSEGDSSEAATFKAIKTLTVTRYENGAKKTQTMNFAYNTDGHLATAETKKVVNQDDAGGQKMTFEYDGQGQLKSLLSTEIPSPLPQYKSPPDDSIKLTYDAKGRALTSEVYDVNQKLFGTWAYTYNDTASGTEQLGTFTYNLPTPPRLKSKALFDATGKLAKIAFSVDVAAPNTLFEREFFYTTEGALKGVNEIQYDGSDNFKKVFTRVIEIAFKSPGVPEKLSASTVDLNNATTLDTYVVTAYDGDLVAQALMQESLDNGATSTKVQELSVTYEPIGAKPVITVGPLLNHHRKSLMNSAEVLLLFANQPGSILGNL